MVTKNKPGSLFNAPSAEPATPTPAVPGATKRGKHLISAMFEPAAYRQFGMLSAELGVAKQDLLREALNDLFKKHGKPPIA
jgi:hypothetical protein